MSVELIINSSPSEVVVAVLKDKLLTELHKDKGNNNYEVGDFYLGRVRKVIPSLNAAFVDVGYEKDAFLHYLDLGATYSSFERFTKGTLNGKQKSHFLQYNKIEPDIDKHGKIQDLLTSGKEMMVQIAKEPISTKGPRLSCEFTLAGRFLVLVPFSNKISISQRIKSSEERERLKRLISSIKPKNFGVIIRTVAENKKVAELDSDLKELVGNWQQLYSNLKNAKAPKRVLGELNRTSAILRDMLDASFNSIIVNDEKLYNEIKSYIRNIAPDKENIVKFYTSSVPIFERFGVNRQIKSSFGRHVAMPSGAYLIVEHTEAMHVIDVNSGNRKNPDKSQEENALEVNLEAAETIARILKLRDMGGIICVDFIDMVKHENQKTLYNKLREAMKAERAKHNVLPPSKFGVVEITRQRVRPVTDITTNEDCPTCDGTGKVEATVLLTDDIENSLRYIFEDMKEKKLKLTVHPFLSAYLTKGNCFNPSVSKKWMKKYDGNLDVQGDSSHNFLEFHFFDSQNEEIKI